MRPPPRRGTAGDATIAAVAEPETPAAPFATAFTLALPHGRCVGVALPPEWDARADTALAELAPAARAHAAGLAPRRRLTWVGGRLALGRAAAALGAAAGALLPDAAGAPQLAAGLVGSVSHKTELAVALLDRADGWSRGVDLEALAPPRERIARRVLTEAERAGVDALAPAARWEAILLRFSLKEALYKALHPFVRRYVGFLEAELAPEADGSCAAALRLTGGEGPFVVEGRWLRRGDWLLTTCRVRRPG
jgi:4'-phosphopantetheinyl transferase EntD